MRKKISSIVSLVIVLLAIIIFLATKYISDNFGNYLNELLFYARHGINKGGGNAIVSGIRDSVVPFIILAFYLLIPCIGFVKYKIKLKIKIWKFNSIINIPFKHKVLYSIIVLVASLYYTCVTFDVKGYIENFRTESKLYNNHYVDGRKLELIFPEKKKNLIILFAESLESTLISKEKGGEWSYTIIPEMEELATKNINFSHNDKLGGSISTTGTTWTSSGMVAQTAGVSMSVFAAQDVRNNYRSNNFLSGTYTLGDILNKNGYNLELIIGSDAEFGGRAQYFGNHGSYKIFDYVYAKEQGLVDEFVWWGYEDYKMFDFAKEELAKLSSQKEPFNLIMLTADTHFENGCPFCIREENRVNKYDSQYENVYASSSKEIYNFIKWLEKQDYYDDTTIVIIGDHISMQTSYFTDRGIDTKDRTVYNAFINSSIEAKNPKNRLFSSLDIYPTILASIGVEIPGNRIGLGTNLFSGKKTLFEELGVERVQNELGQNSSYYNKYILQADYGLVLEKENEKKNSN